MRASLGAGASIPPYLVVAGSVVALLGGAAYLDRRPILSVRPALLAAAMGTTMAFSEWRNLNLSLVALGTLLICAGATVISLSW